ncbi:Lipoprotein signal peptidase [bioreactor metagenome]|uniref:Lipoprotein signal peptidase n=1 Tax=bioreactor metagenome TaxID=1076179 RepID=A0A644VB25_9ZZZZ|nr:signal peptidase II [Acidaminococcaceae bacterium]
MYLIIVVFVVVMLDQITKYMIVRNMTEGMSIPIIDQVFHLTFVLNPGAAFGMLEHNREFFIIMAIVVLMFVVYMRKKILEEPLPIQIGIALFVGGALGNLIDRMKTGLVVDFFDFRIWPVFNIADIAICLGVGVMIWSIIREELKSRN